MTHLQNIDRALLSFFSEGIRNDFFDTIMPFLSRINNYGEVWIALAIILMMNKNTTVRRFGISMLIALAISNILGNVVIKNMVARVRPIGEEFNFDFIIHVPKSFSFPSGHTSTSFAVFGVAYFSKARYRYGVLVLAIFIAFSRIYLHVHYPSDILGGIFLGLLSGNIAVHLGRAFLRKDE